MYTAACILSVYRDGMVRMINERGLELYLGSGDETDGHTKELAEKTVTVGDEKWYVTLSGTCAFLLFLC